MKKATRIILPIIILASGFALMFFFFNMKSEPERHTAVIHPKIVSAIVVQPGEVSAEISSYGRIISAQPVTLYTEVPGTLIAGDVQFRPAQSFKKGDLLVRIDDRQARLSLNSAKSELLSALALLLPEINADFPGEFDTWQRYFNGVTFGKKLAPLPETNNQKIRLYLSRLKVYKLYFQVQDLAIRLEKHFIYAPFGGSIVSADMSVGSTVRSGSNLGSIINLDQLEVELPVQVEDIEWIDFDKPVSLYSAELQRSLSGKIDRVGAAIDIRTQTVPIYIKLAEGNEATLIDGVFLTASIPGIGIRHGVVVPRSAIYDEHMVYVIENGRLEIREIKFARREASTVIVSEGLNPGDTLVTELMQGIAPGMPAVARLNTVQEQID